MLKDVYLENRTWLLIEKAKLCVLQVLWYVIPAIPILLRTGQKSFPIPCKLPVQFRWSKYGCQ